MSLSATPTYAFTTSLNVSISGVTQHSLYTALSGSVTDTGGNGFVADLSFSSAAAIDWTTTMPAGVVFEAVVASGAIAEGVTYVVREADITYDSATVAEDATFVGVAGETTYSGSGKAYSVTGARYWLAAYNPETDATAVVTILAKYTDEQVIGIVPPGKSFGPVLLDRGIKIKTGKATEGTIRVFVSQY